MVNRTIHTNPTETESVDPQLVDELDITIEELMDEVAERARYARDTKPPGSFTLREFMERRDMTEWTARRLLKRQVADGFLLTEKIVLKGCHNVSIWWRA